MLIFWYFDILTCWYLNVLMFQYFYFTLVHHNVNSFGKQMSTLGLILQFGFRPQTSLRWKLCFLICLCVSKPTGQTKIFFNVNYIRCSRTRTYEASLRAQVGWTNCYCHFKLMRCQVPRYNCIVSKYICQLKTTKYHVFLVSRVTELSLRWAGKGLAIAWRAG